MNQTVNEWNSKPCNRKKISITIPIFLKMSISQYKLINRLKNAPLCIPVLQQVLTSLQLISMVLYNLFRGNLVANSFVF